MVLDREVEHGIYSRPASSSNSMSSKKWPCHSLVPKNRIKMSFRTSGSNGPTNDVILFRKSRARVRGSTLYSKISASSLLQLGRGSYSSSLRLISCGGASSLKGFQDQIANRTSESPASKQSQLTRPKVDAEFWTMLKHLTYPTTDANRPIRRRNSNGHCVRPFDNSSSQRRQTPRHHLHYPVAALLVWQGIRRK